MFLKPKKQRFFFFFSFLFILSILGYGQEIYSNIKINKEKEAIQEKAIFKEVNESFWKLINPPQDENDPYWLYVQNDFYQVDLTELKKENSDTIAWLKVMGTNIDEVVVQGQDNKYYLNHSFNQKKNKAGWIFSDYRNDLNNLKANSIIYAHGRKDKTMFGSLENVLEEEWFNNPLNHLIYLTTENYYYLWQIFSVYKIPNESYYLRNNFLNKETYQTFLETIKKRSYYDFSTSLNVNDKILTLSTCKNNNGNRIVVQAKLIKKQTKKH